MDDALVLIFTRNSFYKRQYRLALGAFVLSLFVIAILISILVYLLTNPQKPLYFAADKVGRLIHEQPLTEPNMSPEAAVSWVIEAVESAYSYDFINFRSQLQNSEKYFTNYGWNQYMKALEASNNLLALNQRKMVVIAKVVEPPKLITAGILGGSYAWKYQMPVLINYWLPPFNNKSHFYNPIEVSIIIQRQPLLKSYQGVGILQLIGSFGASSTKPLSATQG